jgi:tRNA(Ile)-lysidine synthase
LSWADLNAFSPQLPLGVAYSGGADSTALLWACVKRWPGQVHAVHVHHGLQSAADQFETHCRSQCAAWQVPLVVRRVDARHASGQSPEDAARQARYAVLQDVAHHEWSASGIQDIALAQHADDQVETLLLALSRGAGLPGLAAMPAYWERGGLRWHRPFLQVPALALREGLRAEGVSWVEDPSNQDLRYTRNRIRAKLLPELQAVFPQFRTTFARSAAHAAQAQRLLNDLAELDGGSVRRDQALDLKTLQSLSRERQANLLRYWLLQQHQTTPNTAQLQECLRQIEACRTRGHQIDIKVGRGRIVRMEGLLTFTPYGFDCS